MSGNIGEKARAAFLALIMITSVMAAGVAFSGSAAASSISQGEGVVLADNADSDDSDASHIFKLQVPDDYTGSLGDSNAEIKLSYENGDHFTQSNGQITSDITGDDAINVFVDGEGINAGTPSADLTDENVTIDFGDSTTFNGNEALSGGETITVVLDYSSTGTDLGSNPSDSQEVDAIVQNDSSETTSFNNLALNLDDDAPITVLDSNGDTVANHSVLSSAATDASAGGEIEISGDVDNVDPTGSLSIDNEATSPVNVTGVGDSTPTVYTSVDNSRVLSLADNSNELSIEGVDFEVETPTDALSGYNHLFRVNGDNATVDNVGINTSLTSASDGNFVSSQAILDLQGQDAEVTGSEFGDDYDGSSGNGLYAIQTRGSGDRPLIDDNTFNTGAGVYVAAENTTVSNNVFNVDTAAVYTSDSGSNTLDNLVVSTNEIYKNGSSSSGYAITLGDGDGMTIEDNLIDGGSSEFSDGIVVESKADTTGTGSAGPLGNVTIENNNEIYNVSSNGVLIADNGAYKDAPVTITVADLTVGETSTNGVNINVGNAKAPDIEVTDSSIDQASTGILVNEFDNNNRQNITVDNVDINGSSSAGIDIASSNNAPNSDDLVEVTDSTFTNNAGGINVTEIQQGSNTASGAEFNIHFNTFEDNTDAGVYVDDSDFPDVLNLTFNDFENNANNALEVNAIDNDGTSDDGVVNANYSWWDNRDSSRIVGPYTPQNAGSQLPIPRRVYLYTRLHTGGQP